MMQMRLTRTARRLLQLLVVTLLGISWISHSSEHSTQNTPKTKPWQDYLGVWQTIDDKTNQPRSLINLSVVDGELQAVISKVYPIPNQPSEPICKECRGELKNAKIIGLNILKDMQFDDGQWQDGQILDPENGKFYDAKIWLEKDKLKVRGYIGFFFRTQQWQRVSPAE